MKKSNCSGSFWVVWWLEPRVSPLSQQNIQIMLEDRELGSDKNRTNYKNRYCYKTFYNSRSREASVWLQRFGTGTTDDTVRQRDTQRRQAPVWTRARNSLVLFSAPFHHFRIHLIMQKYENITPKSAIIWSSNKQTWCFRSEWMNTDDYWVTDCWWDPASEAWAAVQLQAEWSWRKSFLFSLL